MNANAPTGAEQKVAGTSGVETAETPQEGGMKVDFSKVGHCMSDYPADHQVVREGATS